MAFRANEEEENGYQRAVSKLVGPSIESALREKSKSVLRKLIAAYGPVVESYPHWHPLVSGNRDKESPVIFPDDRCGYKGLDHSIYLRNAIITCPYGGEAVFKSVEKLNARDALDGVASISAEKIDAQIYHPDAAPILIKCEWDRPLNKDGTIPMSLAVPLLLEREVPCWRWAQFAETWETMNPYFLGRPCGSRSSLFVDQETGQALKTIWNALIKTGMYGPVKMG